MRPSLFHILLAAVEREREAFEWCWSQLLLGSRIKVTILGPPWTMSMTDGKEAWLQGQARPTGWSIEAVFRILSPTLSYRTIGGL